MENVNESSFVNELSYVNEIVKELIKQEQQIPVNIAFVTACMNGEIEKIKDLFQKNTIDPNIGIVPACRSCHIDVVKFLLEMGADPNYRDKMQKNWCPILAAMIGNNWDNQNKNEIVNELVKYGGIITPLIFNYMHFYAQTSNNIKNSKKIDVHLLMSIF